MMQFEIPFDERLSCGTFKMHFDLVWNENLKKTKGEKIYWRPLNFTPWMFCIWVLDLGLFYILLEVTMPIAIMLTVSIIIK